MTDNEPGENERAASSRDAELAEVAWLSRQTPRRCLAILETEYDAKGGYIPVLVVEGEAGYHPMRGRGEPFQQPWFWGHDLNKAKELAVAANARLGISAADAEAILISSFAAQGEAERRREAELEARRGDRRYG